MRFASRDSDAPGPHYTGSSGDWVEDQIDLTRFAGEVIQIRFEYITNNALAGPGVVLDDIQVPELGLLDTVETLDAGWQADGFLRTQQMVEQYWSVTLIKYGALPKVQPISIDAGAATTQIEVPVEGATLLISAMAPFTLQPSDYRLILTRLD
jgi:bacillopeptidase F (M6 metalloprotease family)